MAITNVGGSYASSAASGAASTRKGISGLASGLNTDEIIEAMTSGTTGKITKLQQSRQKTTWQMSTIRNITDKLIGFSQKYMASSSSSNLMNPNFFENATISAIGKNANAVSIRGTSSSIKNFGVYGVSKMATTEGFTTGGLRPGQEGVSSGKIISDGFNADMFLHGKDISKLEGEAINIKYNNVRYDINISDIDMNLSPGAKSAIKTFNDTYATVFQEEIGRGTSAEQAAGIASRAALEKPMGAEKVSDVLKRVAQNVQGKVEAAINKGIEKAGLGGKLKGEFDATSGKFGLAVLDDNNAGRIAKLEITGIGVNASNYLGFSAEDLKAGLKADEGGKISGKVDSLDPLSSIAAVDVVNMKDALSGKSIVFDLDGVKKTIKFDTYSDPMTFDDLYRDFAAKIQTAFNGKVTLSITDPVDASGNPIASGVAAGGKLTLSTTDNTSILSLASGTSGVTGGKGVLGLNVGDANRLLMDSSLESLAGKNSNADLSAIFGNNGLSDASFKYDSNGNITEISGAGATTSLTVNGTSFKVYNNAIEITGKDGTKTNLRYDKGVSMRNIIDAVNNSDAGVSMKYNSTTDSFTVTATDSGSYGKAEVGGVLGDALFGSTASRVTTDGQDAELTVSFDGGKTLTQITRSSNAFTMNDMDITLNTTFNADGEIKVDGSGKQIFVKPGVGGAPDTVLDGEITFNAKMNTEDIVDSIKEMVDAYNELIKLANDEKSTKPNKEYAPLTEEQRKAMSADEIKNWEEKAKQGLLFNDSDITSLTQELRFVFSMPIDGKMLSEIGISTSKEWKDNGKLVIDENALKKALEERPDDVKKLFAQKSSDNDASESGVMYRMKTVLDKYAATTGEKGILIQRAGNSASPVSLLQNTLQTKLDDMDKQMKVLKDRLKTEQDRYYKQFTYLETYINQMNSQSSWLSQQTSS